MRVLLSAYSCLPGFGSEPGVGWNFAVELSNLGHDVIVLTRASNRKRIENGLIEPNVAFLYYDLPKWISSHYRKASASDHIYCFFWQIGAYFYLRKFLRKTSVDVIHHVTLGVFRTPSFLCLFSPPFIFGPIGGGENYSLKLKRSFPLPLLIAELSRDVVNVVFSMNPLLLMTFHRSQLIICRTKDTLRYIPKRFHNKCIIDLGIGHRYGAGIAKPKLSLPSSLKLLYAGRPLHWKGIGITVKSFAKLKECGVPASLTIIGIGNSDWAKKEARKINILDAIDWRGKVEYEELIKLYGESDLLIFPSLREAGGMVAIEAMAYGLPVICLNLGGPQEVVNHDCGVVINVDDMNESQLIKSMTESISGLHQNRQLLSGMKSGALSRSKHYSWRLVVQRIYQQIEDFLPEASP